MQVIEDAKALLSSQEGTLKKLGVDMRTPEERERDK